METGYFFCASITPKILIASGSIAKHACINDGCMDLIFCNEVGRVNLFLLLTGIDQGTVADLPFVKYVKVKAFKLEPDNSVRSAPIAIDGEPTNNKAIQVEVHKAVCKVYYDWNGKKTQQ